MQNKYPSLYKHALVTPGKYGKYDKNGVHALFIDFCKAFDLVDHGILLRKLAEINVTKGFWFWERSCQDGRSQQVKFGESLSPTKPCPAGVP